MNKIVNRWRFKNNEFAKLVEIADKILNKLK